MADWINYLEGNCAGNSREEYLEQVSKDKIEAVQIAKEVEKLYAEYENRSDIDRYLVDGAILRCNQATLRPFKMSDGTVLPIQYKNDEINDRRETEGAYATEKRDKRRQRLYTELHVTDMDMTTGTFPNATVLDSKKYKNIPPFRCHCKLMDDRKEEYDKIKANMDDCKKNGVCQYLMRLNDKWENFPREGKNFYEKKEDVECITMTSMIFCRHGGLITPVFSGQVRAESDAVPQFPGVMRVSDKLIALLKDYEGKPGTHGEPYLTPYKDNKGVKTIGWGHALSEDAAKTVILGGKSVNLDTAESINMEQAEELLMHDIWERERDINQKLEEHGIAEMVNQRFYDALFDLLFQIGTNRYGEDKYGHKDLTGFLTEGNFDLTDSTEIKYQFGEYSEKVCGSMCRRLDELDIIFSDNYTREYNIVRYGDIWGKKSNPNGKINWETDITYESEDERAFYAEQIKEITNATGTGGNPN